MNVKHKIHFGLKHKSLFAISILLVMSITLTSMLPVHGQSSDIEGIYYSDQLEKGEKLTWDVEMIKPNSSDLKEPDLHGLEEGSEIELTIINELSGVNFHTPIGEPQDDPDINEYFEINIDGEKYNQTEEPLYSVGAGIHFNFEETLESGFKIEASVLLPLVIIEEIRFENGTSMDYFEYFDALGFNYTEEGITITREDGKIEVKGDGNLVIIDEDTYVVEEAKYEKDEHIMYHIVLRDGLFSFLPDPTLWFVISIIPILALYRNRNKT